ncbi:MAG: hypothetical protein FWD35_05655, partial [Oscillospiraceae bacterium]|nr:hypothetical protein [Oscillospiraceae bacterium]
IAGGFSRYATDEKWLVPHFEKMLYDNALLAQAYLTAYELHGESFCKTAAQKVFSWAFAELMYTETVGGVEFSAFYSGQDADSDGIEGGYYLFERAELDAVLGEESAKRYAKHFGVTKKGNAPGIADGKALNILNLSKNAKFASRDSFIDECSHKLYSYRRRRAAISTDTKILTSQNALMLIALVKAYEVLGDPSYLNAARAVERFITTKLSFGGRLCVRWCADSATGGIGEVFGNGKLDDYANFALALMQLYEITGEREFLDKAAHYGEIMRSRFADNTLGGFFLYADDDEQLISRPKEIFDGATPSGNSTAFMVLALLSKHRSPCDEPHWRELFAQQTNFLADYAANYPMGCAFTLTTALEFVV